MVCSRCGNQIQVGERFCPYCGNPQNTTPVYPGPAPQPAKAPNTKVIVIIIAVVAAVLVVILAAFFIIRSKSGSQNINELLSLGQKYLDEGDYSNALLTFESILEIDDRCVEAYVGASEAYIRLDRIQDAIDILRRGFDITGDYTLENKIRQLTALDDSAMEEADDTETEEELITAQEFTALIEDFFDDMEQNQLLSGVMGYFQSDGNEVYTSAMTDEKIAGIILWYIRNTPGNTASKPLPLIQFTRVPDTRTRLYQK